MGFPYVTSTSEPLTFNATGTQIAVGNFHALAVQSDGTLKGWGLGNSGILFNGITLPSYRPTTGTLSGVTAVACGNSAMTNTIFSLALLSDGTVRAVGYGLGGQLGDGTSTQRNSPVTLLNPPGSSPMTRVVSLDGGTSHTLLVRTPAVTPTLTSVSPTGITAGSGSQTFTVNGTNFAADSDPVERLASDDADAIRHADSSQSACRFYRQHRFGNRHRRHAG